jgi:perosamine synthetase
LCQHMARRLPRERIVSKRRQNYEFLSQHTSGFAGLRPLLPHLPADCAPYVFPLWTEHPDPGYTELRRLGMPVFRWDRVWPGVPRMAEDHGLRWSHHVLQLACHQDMTALDLQTLVKQVLLACRAELPSPKSPLQPPSQPLPSRVTPVAQLSTPIHKKSSSLK